jgi:uncharacterized protein
MKMTLKYIVAFILLQINLLAQTNQYHAVIPDLPSTPALVNDLGNLLTSEEEEKLEKKLKKFNKETSNEIAVVTVESLGDLEVSQFANELGRKWGIGEATKRNGVLVLISKKGRKANISPSDKLQGALPDVVCSRIIRNDIIPNCKKEQYFIALDKATDHILAATKGEFTNDELEQGKEIHGFSAMIILLVFAFLFVAYMYFFRDKNNIYVSGRGYQYGGDEWAPRGGGYFGGGFFGGGFGGNSNDHDGGSFEGFGGGGSGFDGGGASGSW